MNSRKALVAVALFGALALVSCKKLKDKLLGHHDPVVVAEAPQCTIHPGWCRGRCKTFFERKIATHADRISSSTGFAIGTCGTHDVFAENDAKGGGIVEYYDGDTLVAATDSRPGATCAAYGEVPSCTLDVKWRDAGTSPDYLLERDQ